MSVKDINGSVYIVTGGTQGLGKEIALNLAEKGACGVVICGRNREKGEKVVIELEARGAEAVYVPADLSREEDCRRVVAVCDKRFGRVNGLVNAAGTTDRGTIEDTSVDLWDRMLAVNARAPFLLIQESVKIMKRMGEGGSIVNIISDQYHGGYPFLTAYAASKGALASLTKNTANALNYDRIRVNGICIGWMYTPHEHLVQMQMGKSVNWLEEEEPKQPFRRILRPGDVSAMALFLLGSQGEMITGSLIDLNQHVIGGM